MRKANEVIGFASALAIVLGVLCSLSAGAFAEDFGSMTAPVKNTPQCMQVYLNGKTTSACFNLSDE
jgi:hypothetical protein